ncbi:LppU family putative lipoprotein [Nocardia shimofusensis]|uniref:LppU family putative lipoprotein n=1 Tax=Nocardia shimofusensis TaxID=228596 RepID=UPI0008361B80|nr:hypothetical protein [Nocardia shimofusensis]
MSRQLLSGLALAVGIAVAAFTLSACGSTVDGHAQPAVGGTIDALTSTPKPGPPKPSTPPKSSAPRTTTQEAGDTDFQAEIGDCVTLGGTTTDATIAKASCGSRASNYKVIGKATSSALCPADRDNYYAETLNGLEQGAFCLDIDWVIGGCMDIGGDDPQRIDCGESGLQPVRVDEIVQGAGDVGACDTGFGFEYTERRFVVCVEEL